ncbi:hypothetical protein A7309_03360 [Paenibacillus polymyxa]|uniref:hypothetical protein n=1 Tax=Paenibacillus sp. FSL P2-0322 TaxID=2921628 RepID=UPI00048E026E|nr:hypothetical protein A7309_03360 [Paenibacillus polymyxa]SFR13378.1 hypothetical protein SAMN04488603_103426 [Paenibacillus sp. cl130]
MYHHIYQSGRKLYKTASDKGHKYNDQSKFSKIIECNGSHYFITLNYPGIVKLNMEDHRIEIIDERIEPVQKMIFDPERGYLSNSV